MHSRPRTRACLSRRISILIRFKGKERRKEKGLEERGKKRERKRETESTIKPTDQLARKGQRKDPIDPVRMLRDMENMIHTAGSMLLDEHK